MSDVSRASIYLIEEATRGVTPATGNLNELAFTSFNLTAAPQSTQSALIRQGRIPADSIKTGDEVQGSIASEFSEDTFDLLLEAGMCNRWDTGGPTVDTLEIGDMDITFSIMERWGYLAAGAQLHLYPGCQVGAFNINVQNEEIVNIDFNFGGQTVNFLTAPPAGLVEVPATPGRSLNACQDTTNVQIDGAALNTIISSVSLEVNNNIRAISGLGVCGPQRFAKDQAVAGGAMELYHDDQSETLYRNSVNNTPWAFEFSLATGGKTYTFKFPNVKASVPGPTAEGQGSDVTLTANYSIVDQSLVIERTR